MDRKTIEMIAYESRKIVDSPDLEKILVAQEDSSLRSPGTEAHYYRFLYRLAQFMKPKLSLELGTHTGISARCLAEGNPEGQVITVNNHWELKEENVRPNIRYCIHDSLVPVELPGSIDILFSDTFHDGVRPLNEYHLYKDKMAEGGVVFFDDIFIFDMMKKFWSDFNPEKGQKFELPIHGWVGFGVVLL
jgi:predicted O-methyltransferase YrrM